MRKHLVGALLLPACLAIATVAQADTFGQRFVYPFPYESSSESPSAALEPVTNTMGAMKLLPLILNIVAQLDRAANLNFDALQAHLHIGGGWDAVALWTVPVKRWPVLSAIEAEQEGFEPSPVALGSDSRARLALYAAERVDIRWQKQEVNGMIHIPYSMEERTKR